MLSNNAVTNAMSSGASLVWNKSLMEHRQRREYTALSLIPYDATVARGSAFAVYRNSTAADDTAKAIAMLLSHQRVGEKVASHREDSANEGWSLGATTSGRMKPAVYPNGAAKTSLERMGSTCSTPLFRGVATDSGLIVTAMSSSFNMTAGRSFLDSRSAQVSRLDDGKANMSSLFEEPLRQELERIRYGRATDGFGLPLYPVAHVAGSINETTSLDPNNSSHSHNSSNPTAMMHLLDSARMGHTNTTSPMILPLFRADEPGRNPLSLVEWPLTRPCAMKPLLSGPACIESINGSVGAIPSRSHHVQRDECIKRAHEGDMERVDRLPSGATYASLSGPSAGITSPSNEAFEFLVNAFQGRRHSLHLPAHLFCSTDPMKLSPVQLLLRQQIEAFQATEADVMANVRGRKNAVRLGQVGIRCRHCAALPALYRGKGSTYFPTSVWGFYQAAQNMCTLHFQNDVCSVLPGSIQTTIIERIASKKEQKGSNSGAGRAYWATTAQKMGLVDMKEGVFFICNLPNDVSLPDITDSPGVYRVPPSKKRKVEPACA